METMSDVTVRLVPNPALLAEQSIRQRLVTAKILNLNNSNSVVNSVAQLKFILFAQCRVAICVWERDHGMEVRYPIPTDINAAIRRLGIY